MSDERPPHPLFPLAEDADDPESDAPDVQHIMVTRREAAGVVTSPYSFAAGDLMSLEQLHGLYGGGIYELIGRGPNGRIVARKSYTIPGPSKPLFKEQADSEKQAGATPPDMAAVVAKLLGAQQQASSGTTLQTVIALLGALAPVITQYLANSAQTAQQQHAAQQNFLATLLSQSQAQSDKFVSVMQTLHNNAGASGGTVTGPGSSEFQKGVKWMEDFIAGQMEQQGENKDGAMDFNGLVELAKLALQAEATAPAVSSPSNGSHLGPA